jgi:hypothetical protein
MSLLWQFTPQKVLCIVWRKFCFQNNKQRIVASLCAHSELEQLICTCGRCSKNDVCSNNPVAEDDLPIGIWHLVSSVLAAELHCAVNMFVMWDMSAI